jgi:hypothetical protein
MKRLITLFLFAICPIAASTSAQVSASRDRLGWYDVEIPERIDIPIGEYPLVRVHRKCFSTRVMAEAAIPDRVTVRTVSSDWGVDGFYISNSNGWHPTHFRPLALVWGVGQWELQTSQWNLPVGSAMHVSGTKFVQISPTPLAPIRDRGPWSLNLFLDPDQAAVLPAGVVNGINQALGRIRTRFQALISADAGGAVNVMLTFQAPPHGSSNICGTAFPTGSVSVTYPSHRTDLETFAESDQEPAGEINVYTSLTPASAIPFFWNSPTPTVPATASTIKLPPALARKFFHTTVDPLDAVIVCDSGQTFDLDHTDGTNPGQLDFDGIITHEVFHALGFNCGIDFAAPGVAPDLFALDLFRLEADVAPTVDSNEMFTRPRQLRRDVESVAGMLLNSGTAVCPMSRGTGPGGDGRQASHWKAGALNAAGRPLGIMVPATRFGPTAGPGISPPDILALDILGWNIQSISSAAGAAAPQPAQLVQPANEAFLTSLTPTLEWTTDGSEDVVHVAVFRRQAGLHQQRVLFSQNLTGVTSLVVPAGVLVEFSMHGRTVRQISTKTARSRSRMCLTSLLLIFRPCQPQISIKMEP